MILHIYSTSEIASLEYSAHLSSLANIISGTNVLHEVLTYIMDVKPIILSQLMLM